MKKITIFFFLIVYAFFILQKSTAVSVLLNQGVNSNPIDSSNDSCIVDNDCPLGICSNGKTYQAYACLDNKCHQLNFFADPCQFLSSSGGNTEAKCKCNNNQAFINNECVE